MQTIPSGLRRALHVLLLLAATLLWALHLVHLQADFPNDSRWMDWSKYTDEGWYGDAAIRHFQLGHWYVPGDFNPAAALPVWPLTEAIVFRFTGVSLTAARALTVCVFGGILVVSWMLLARRRRGVGAGGDASLAASVGVLLLAANPFCFVFTRIAIIEPMLVLLILVALWTAQRVRASAGGGGFLSSLLAAIRVNAWVVIGLGVLLPALVLTKTTALFVVPAIAWMLLAGCGFDWRLWLRVGLPAAALGLGLWAGYFFGIIRPHYLEDYRYLFSANAYTGMTRQNFVAVLAGMLKDGRWMGRVLYPLALAAVAWGLANLRRMRDSPLTGALLLWAGGYMAFLAYHNNLQPRYYLVVAVPLTLLLPVVVEDLVLPRLVRPGVALAAIWVAMLGIVGIVLPDVVETAGFLRHPQYTLLDAARHIRGYIDEDGRTDPGHNRLILSISGSDISLMTGLPSICDDFGTLELVDRVRAYKPGWYVSWNEVEFDKMDSISPLYQLEKVAAFPAMDDPARNLLVLYKLQPNDDVETTPKPKRKGAGGRRPVVKSGQQPSANQLGH